MQFKTNLPKKLPFFVALGLTAVLTSCGSFQYAGYDNDGIYSTETYKGDVVDKTVVTTNSDDSNYYKNYFTENKAQLEAITSENEVFTDIDSYEGNYLERAQDTIEQRPIYGGWGQNNETVTINYIDNGWIGWNDPWLFNPGWGFGWNNWAWGPGWGYYPGWGLNWGWGAGWGLGWNYLGANPAWGYPGYGNGWNNAWPNYHNTLAYAGSRRGTTANRNTLGRRSASNSAISRNDYSTRRLANATVNTRRVTRETGIRSNGTSRYGDGVTRSSRTMRNPSSTRPGSNTGVYRPNENSRPSGTSRYQNSNSRSTRSIYTPSVNSRSSNSTRSSSPSRSSSARSSSPSRSSSGRSSSSSRGRGRG